MRISPLDINVFANNYNICICEGAAEDAIINLLLDHDKLIFTRDSLLGKKVEKIRPADKITDKYLKQSYTKDVNILRILDSRRERFKLGKLYIDRFPVYNFYTTPEIEILIIIEKGDFNSFSRGGVREKPSDYCKRTYGMSNVKEKDFMRQYFYDINILINTIKEYNRLSGVHEHYNLYNLLKPGCC